MLKINFFFKMLSFLSLQGVFFEREKEERILHHKFMK